MSKFFKALSLVLVFVFCFAAIPVSAQEIDVNEMNVQLVDVTENSGQDAEDTGISPFGPALPVTKITPAGGEIRNGRVYIVMRVTGQGSYYATWDGMQAKYNGCVGMIGYNPVTDFYEEFDCGPAYVGNHTFYLKATSYNFPYEWKDISVGYTIS